MDRALFAAGATLALIGVAAGAFGAHALAARLPADRLATFEIAVRYQMYHALALLAVAWATSRWPAASIHIAGWLFLAGILVFSGTVYALALGAHRGLGALTPLGGLLLLAGWAWLAWSVARA
jgi:uncharacterized membrane protein YgdD (TMEM256/DUF423 family)